MYFSQVESTEILIVVPLFNEEVNVCRVLQDLQDEIEPDSCHYTILMIDDGSSDCTHELISNELKKTTHFRNRYISISLPCNMGVGMVHRIGFSYAKMLGFNRLIQFDGDGQHKASEIKFIMEGLNSADYVIGSRFGGCTQEYEMPVIRRTASRLISMLVHKRTKLRLLDVTSGFRAANRRAIEVFAGLYPIRYLSDSVESILIANQKGLSITEIQIKMEKRTGGLPSHKGFKIAREFLYLLGNISIFYGKNNK